MSLHATGTNIGFRANRPHVDPAGDSHPSRCATLARSLGRRVIARDPTGAPSPRPQARGGAPSSASPGGCSPRTPCAPGVHRPGRRRTLRSPPTAGRSPPPTTGRHAQGARLAVDPRLDAAHEPVAVQERQHVVAPAPLRLPGRRPPSGSRSRTGARSRSRSQASGSSGARNATPGATDGRPALAAGEATPASTSAAAASSQRQLPGQHEPPALEPLHARPPRSPPRQQLVAQSVPLGRRRRAPPRSCTPRSRRAARYPGTGTGACGAAARARAGAARAARRREQPLDQVVVPAVALAARDRQDPGLGERLEDRAHLVGRPPVPVDGGARLPVERTTAAPPSGSAPPSSSTSGACSSNAPPRAPRGERSHVIRYHGSSAVGTSENILLYVS